MKNSSSQHNSSFKHLILWLILLVLLTITALYVLDKRGIIKLSHPRSDIVTTSGPTKAEQKQQSRNDAQNKQDFLDNTSSQSQQNKGDNPTTDPPSTTSPKPLPTLTLTASQSGASVTILTNMQNVPSGTCKLTVTNGTANTTQVADVIYQPQFSSCAGFSVPTSSVGSGLWQISVSVVPSGGSPLSQTTTLGVK